MAEFSVKGFALFMWWSVWRLLLFNRHTRLLYTDRSAPLLYTQVCCSSLDCSTAHYLSLSSAICMVSWAIYSMLNIRYRRQPNLWQPKHNFKTRTKTTLCIWKMCRQKPGQSCITLGGNTAKFSTLRAAERDFAGLNWSWVNTEISNGLKAQKFLALFKKMCRQNPGQSCITLGGNTAEFSTLRAAEGFLQV